MKSLLRKIFSPILKPLEAGTDDYAYKPSHRTILIALGVLFTFLASVVLFFTQYTDDLGYFFPVIIFGGSGALSMIVGLLGTNRAIAKIWGSR